jgi:protein involved in polysaccharide export with SLBB domain
MAPSSLRDRASIKSTIGAPRSLILGLAVLSMVTPWGCQQPDTRMSVETFLTAEGGVAATQPSATPPRPWSPGPYRLGPGDVVNVTISAAEGAPAPAQTVQIDENGEMPLPAVGMLKVGGMTLSEAEEAVKKACAAQYAKPPLVTVSVNTYRSIDVIVLGEIRLPAPVSLRRDRTSVLQAILAAGGPTPDASGQVTLIPARNPDQTLELNLNRREDIIRAAQIGALQDSDVLIVERRNADAVYVEGLVNTPGHVPLPKGATMSALQAIAASGGTLLAFDPREATLIRRKPTGDLIRVKLELHKILAGEQPDVALAAGDIVLVPHNFDTRLEEFLAKTSAFRWGVDTVYNPWSDFYFRQSIKATRASNGGNDAFSVIGQLQTVAPPPITPVP